MKKIILVLAVILSISAYSQETEFKYTKETGFTDYVVTNVTGSQSELYAKSIKWIKENYINPDEVIKMQIENEKIRFEGVKIDYICNTYGKQTACANVKYLVEVSLKDGKYKLDPIELNAFNVAGTFEVPLNNLSIYYDKKGQLLKGSENTLIKIQELFNGINLSLNDYINGKPKDKDW